MPSLLTVAFQCSSNTTVAVVHSGPSRNHPSRLKFSTPFIQVSTSLFHLYPDEELIMGFTAFASAPSCRLRANSRGHFLSTRKVDRVTSVTLSQSRKPRVRLVQAAADPVDSEAAESTMEQEDGALDVDGDAVVVKPDQRLAAAFTFLGGFLIYNGTSWTVIGLPFVVFGAFLYFQTTRIRFVFGPAKLNVASRSLRSGELTFIRGWAYDEFAAWDIYPTPSFPILAYFRERESYGGRGSIHFFPILADGQQLRDLLEKRTGRQRG